MFDKDYSFHGRHAERAKALTKSFDEDGNAFFKSNVEVYLLAPIVGFIYERKADRDNSVSEKANIQLGQINTRIDDFQFHYRLIMLMDKKNEPNLDFRVDKAFRHYGTPEAEMDEILYEKYVMGGIDVLYENLIEPTKGAQDFVYNLFRFMEDFDIKNAMKG